MKPHSLSLAIILPILLAVWLTSPSGHAAPLYTWDITQGDGATVTGGTGAWTPGAGNWNDGVTDVNWVAGSDATFGGTPGTVTLGGAVNVGSITFNADYLIDGGGNTLTLSSSTIIANTNATISATLDGTSGLAKDGAGALSLTGSTANTYSGSTNVAEGTLLLNKSGSANAIGNGGLTINGSGIVQYVGTSTNMIGTGRVNLDLNGTLDFNGKTDTIGNVSTTAGIVGQGDTPLKNTAGGGNLTIGTLTIKPIAGGTTSVFDAGIDGTLTLGGTVTFNVSGFGGGGDTAGRAQITGTTLALGGNRIFNVAAGTGSTYDLEISNAITGSTNTLTKSTGTGRLQFSGTTANTYDGLTTVSAGTLILNKTAAVAIAGNLTIGNGATTAGLDIVQLNGSGGNQIADTSIVTLNGTSNNAGILRMNARSETIGGLVSAGGAGIVENGTSGTSTLTLDVNTTNRSFAGILQNGAAGTLALTKTGTATQTLSGANTYTGTTTVSQGSLIINGAVASTSVVVDGSLGGSGVMANATLSGSGSINPGNSPGIMTAAATNPTGGLDYNFEFTVANGLPDWDAPTASGNDVLRLTNATPFTGAMAASNAVTIYLNVASLSIGDVFTGGFYTDQNADFEATLASATFQYFLADAGGATTYGGNTYSSYAGPLGFDLATVSQSADFGASAVNGYTMQFTVIPETNVTVLLGGCGILALLRRRRVA